MKKILISLSVLILCIGCATIKENKSLNPGSSSSAIIKNISGEWKLEKLLNKNVKNKNMMLIFLEDNKISGRASVNRYFGNYNKNEQDIKIEVHGLTRMAGSQEDMDLELQYIKLLEEVEKVEIIKDNLVLKTKKGNLIYKK